MNYLVKRTLIVLLITVAVVALFVLVLIPNQKDPGYLKNYGTAAKSDSAQSSQHVK